MECLEWWCCGRGRPGSPHPRRPSRVPGPQGGTLPGKAEGQVGGKKRLPLYDFLRFCPTFSDFLGRSPVIITRVLEYTSTSTGVTSAHQTEATSKLRRSCFGDQIKQQKLLKVKKANLCLERISLICPLEGVEAWAGTFKPEDVFNNDALEKKDENLTLLREAPSIKKAFLIQEKLYFIERGFLIKGKSYFIKVSLLRIKEKLPLSSDTSLFC